MALAALPVVSAVAADRSGAAASPRVEGNRITVTGNSASNVRVQCDAQGRRPSVNINSVNVDGKALKGETVIVTGRNTRDVVVDDCPPGDGASGGVNINSVNIR